MASNPNQLQGRIWSVTLGDNERPECQLDATLTMNVNTNETPACKPTNSEAYKGSNWLTYEITTRGFELTFSANAFAQMTGFTQSDIAAAIISGNQTMAFTFGTTETTDYDKAATVVYSGEVIITQLVINAPVEGDSNYDVTLLGNGALTQTVVPFTT